MKGFNDKLKETTLMFRKEKIRIRLMKKLGVAKLSQLDCPI